MLFKNDDLSRKSDHITMVTLANSTESKFIDGVIKSFINELEKDKVYHYANNARWSMHDLLRHFLQITGPAKVWFTTWSITTGPASLIVDLVKSGMITELSAIVSSRIKINCPEALQLLIMNNAKVKLAELHAKTLIIMNDQWAITIVGSQNWSKIKRIEAGVIDTSRSAAMAHIKWIQNEIDRPNN